MFRSLINLIDLKFMLLVTFLYILFAIPMFIDISNGFAYYISVDIKVTADDCCFIHHYKHYKICTIKFNL